VCLALTGGKQQFILDASSGSPQVNFTFGGASSVDVRIGGSGYNGSDGYNGYLSEVLLYTSALSPSQRQQVESYLATKWGLRGNLPSTSWTKLYRSLSPAFTPIQLSGLALWLDAADRSTLTISASNTVTGWTDKSPSQNALTVNSAGTYQPTGFNRSPTIAFTDGNYMTTSTATTFSNSFSMFIVQRTTGSSTYYTILSLGTTMPVMNIWWRADFNSYALLQEVDNPGSGGGVGSLVYRTSNVPMMMSATVSPTSPYWNFYLNGTLSNNPDIGGGGTAPAANLGGSNVSIPGKIVYFGGPSGGGFTGQISEVLLFSNALTASNRYQVEGYLAWKWGLAANLPSNHPFKSFKP
jgi:hypothetical protein